MDQSVGRLKKKIGRKLLKKCFLGSATGVTPNWFTNSKGRIHTHTLMGIT